MGIWYATREQVKSSLEIMETSRSDALVDAKLEASSRSLEGLLHRRFYPERRTVKFDWPNNSSAPTWSQPLGDNELITVEILTSGGTVIAPTDFYLSRGDYRDEPPYSSIEIDLSTSAAFSGGDTFQRSNVVLGQYGYNDVRETAGALIALIASAADTMAYIRPIDGMLNVGVGSVLNVDDERMVVVGRRMYNTTQILQTPMTASQADNILAVPDGTLFAVGETVLLDAERMRVDDIAGNNLIVDRAFDGSALDAHAGSTVYASWAFNVIRGALGSTASAHNSATTVYAQVYPGLINELCIAETVVMLEQNSSGYARLVGSGNNAREGTGKGLEDLRAAAYTAFGRKLRSAAV
jgi:hypothetical protein